MVNINRGVNVSAPKDEWHTPDLYINLVKQVFGGTIDLDPASNFTANKKIQAITYYDITTNGLTKTWTGNVFLNPPYSRTNINAFIDKAIEERPNYKAIIILINSNTETTYSQKLLENCNAVCFTDHRIKFIDPQNTNKDSPVKGNAFYYLGDNKQDFKKVFSQVGTILCLY